MLLAEVQVCPDDAGRIPMRRIEQVDLLYQHVFDAIKLNIPFEIDEIRPLSNDWAYARTRSNGTVKVLGSDQAQAREANQELFVLTAATTASGVSPATSSPSQTLPRNTNRQGTFETCKPGHVGYRQRVKITVQSY
jgi:hypothetical protein